MEFRYPEEYSNSKSPSSEETDRWEDDTGIGRSYECVFCRRGFTTAQALGGHMNIHRKDRAKPKPTVSPSPSTSTSSKVDDNYADLGFYLPTPIHPRRAGAGDNYYSPPATTPELDSNYYPQFDYPYPSTIRSASHLQYPDRDVFGDDWRSRSLSFYSNPFCVPEVKDKGQDNSEEHGLDLELRLGYQA